MLEQQLQRDLEEDRKDAKRELQRYEEMGLGPGVATEHTVSLIGSKRSVYFPFFSTSQWMSVQHKLHPFLLNVFSSSEETCTLRHANLSSPVLEALQILKFSYKQGHLNFTSDLTAEEVDYNISGPVSRKAVDELMSAGELDELAQLLANVNIW